MRGNAMLTLILALISGTAYCAGCTCPSDTPTVSLYDLPKHIVLDMQVTGFLVNQQEVVVSLRTASGIQKRDLKIERSYNTEGYQAWKRVREGDWLWVKDPFDDAEVAMPFDRQHACPDGPEAHYCRHLTPATPDAEGLRFMVAPPPTVVYHLKPGQCGHFAFDIPCR